VYWHNKKCRSTPLTDGVTSTVDGNASPTVVVELGVKLKIQQNYTIKAETYLKGEVSGDTHLHINLIDNLIRININIKDELEKPLKDFVTKYQEDIDEKVAELVKSYNLKKEIQNFWNDVKEPVALGDFWLNIYPPKIIFENLNAQDNKLRIGIGFASKLEIVDSKPIVIESPLPNLDLTQSTEGKFNIYLPSNTSFSYLANLAKNEVVGVQYEKGWNKIKDKRYRYKRCWIK